MYASICVCSRCKHYLLQKCVQWTMAAILTYEGGTGERGSEEGRMGGSEEGRTGGSDTVQQFKLLQW